MGYAEQKAALVTHAVTAGAAVTSDPILDVRAALPVPKGRCIRVYYGGEGLPRRFGGFHRTLNSEMVAERTIIGIFLPLPVSEEDITAATDVQLYTFKDAFRTAVLGDSQLGGEATDLELDYFEPDIVVNGNTRYLFGGFVCFTDFREYSINA